MRTKITCFAVLGLVLAVGLLAYTAYAHWQEKWWDKTVAGVELEQGVAMDVNHGAYSIWGSTVTWADDILARVYARNVGGEGCQGWAWLYWDNDRVSYWTNNTYQTGFDYYPSSGPCSPRILRVRGWSEWWDYPDIDEDHNMYLSDSP
jgi:hypothetical protein